MCVHVCIHVCVHVEARGQHWMSFLRHSLPCFGETGALLGLELTELARLVGQRAPGIPCFRRSSTEITSTSHHTQLILSLGFWEQNGDFMPVWLALC